ncbi:MAG TPA: radical SAM protein [Candidatus Omnitrophota bacterium]|nr:radical SAM protein [Candidatus Omnitrophota bacterium]
MTRLLLLHPSGKLLGRKDNLYTNESLVPSLGLASVAAYCRACGIETRIYDLRLENNGIEGVFERIDDLNPALVGITAFTTEITSAGVLASRIKQKYPDLQISVGGPHGTAMPQETLLEFEAFDSVACGEGEKTTAELVVATQVGGCPDLSKIPGLVYRKEGKIFSNPTREPVADLDTLPFPAWDLFELERYNGIFPLSASRGCPYRCYFCTPNYLGKKVRVKSYQKIMEEIAWLVERFGAKRIQFTDAMMGLLKDESIQMCDELIRSGLGRKIQWDCETRADAVSLGLFQKMKEAGCEWVALGVESGNERILGEVIKKGETKDQIRVAVQLAKRAGLKVRTFFILGHYTETPETIRETIRFALELNPDAIAFGLIVPNPGSEFRKIAETKGSGFRILHNRWEDYQQFNYNCLESETFSLAELKRWQARAYFTFYTHHPIKGFFLFFAQSAYNYRLSGLLKLPLMLLRNLLGKS